MRWECVADGSAPPRSLGTLMDQGTGLRSLHKLSGYPPLLQFKCHARKLRAACSVFRSHDFQASCILCNRCWTGGQAFVHSSGWTAANTAGYTADEVSPPDSIVVALQEAPLLPKVSSARSPSITQTPRFGNDPDCCVSTATSGAWR